jgi:hypothetical protein
VANSCVHGGECRIDADCGPGGYCSPSQVGVLCVCPSPALCDPGPCGSGSCACGDACGHAYYCHTSRDACIDDSDCGPEATCNYDKLEKRWTCAFCRPVP